MNLKELLAENFSLLRSNMFHVNVIELHMSSRHIGSVSNEGIPYVLAGVPDCIMFMVSSDSADMVE